PHPLFHLLILYTPSSSTSFLQYSGHHPHLHSFPTRRSSDLKHRVAFHGARDVGADALGIRIHRHHLLLHRLGVIGQMNGVEEEGDRKSTRLNSSHVSISYAVFCLKKKKKNKRTKK